MWTDLVPGKVIMVVLDKLMVRDVPADSGVPWLWQVRLTLWVSLLLCPAVNRLLDYLPSEVMIGQLSLHQGSGGREDWHDGSKWKEHIVEIPGVVDVHSLIGDLETGGTHAEVHGVHVDHAWHWLLLCLLIHNCVFIFEQWYLNVYFLTSPLVDGLGETQESWVRAGYLLGEEALMRMYVCFFKTDLVCEVDLCLLISVVRDDTVVHSEHRSRCCWDKAQVLSMLLHKLCHELPPKSVNSVNKSEFMAEKWHLSKRK